MRCVAGKASAAPSAVNPATGANHFQQVRLQYSRPPHRTARRERERRCAVHMRAVRDVRGGGGLETRTQDTALSGMYGGTWHVASR